MEIVRSQTNDAALLTAIALAAKAYWGYPAEWMSRWTAGLTITPDYIREYTVYSAIVDQKPVGFYGLIGSPPRLLLDHLWVLPDWIGHGIGRELFQHAVQQAIAKGGIEMEIEADPHAEGFYQRMGSRRFGEYVYDLDGQTRILPRMVFDLAPGG